MNTKKLLFAVAITAAIIGLGVKADALKPPHDATGDVITGCGDCHSKIAPGFRSITSFNSLCFNSVGCHKPIGKGSKKQLSMKDASDRFKNLSALQSGLTDKKHSSHGWKVPELNSNAGVTKAPKMGESARAIGLSSGKIYCTRCHSVMGLKSYPKFLQASPTGNYICFNCHASRRIDNVREPLPSSISFAGVDGAITVAPHYSHPVEVNYSTAHGKKPDFFEATPQLASVFGYRTSASVKLYTTHISAAAPNNSSRLAGSNKGAVVCQSCHGPIHSADSNPYTFDNLSAYSRLGKYSSSAGNLLRMYPIAGSRASDNLCKSCHKVKVHETSYPGLPANYFSCGRCHTPHKKAGEANRYLILENISTPFNGIRPVYFVSTSAMAKRYGSGPTESSSTNKSLLGGYSTSASRLNKDRTASSAICQVCHTRTKYQRNYSSRYNTRRGGTGTGHDLIYDDATGKYRFCPDCHMHTSAFKPSGAAACGSCHSAPPYDTYSSGASTRVIGRHAKHVKYKNGDDSGASYSWDNGALADNRSENAYGFSCGRCHSPYANYSDSQHKPSNFDDNVFSLRTADVGFNIAANAALPKNPGATYAYQNRGVGDWGANNLGSKWSTPAEGGYGQCFNLYCHGQWYNGYTSNNPKFTGTQPCGSCHGAKPNDPPGKTNGVNYGAHPRHVGNANNQQYGFSASPNFRCNACHDRTIYNNGTSIDNRANHVNGRVEIAFDQNANYPGDGNSNYDGLTYSNATSRKPAMSQKPAYKTCRFIYCHSDGSRIETTYGTYSAPFDAGARNFPNWSSSSRGNFTTTLNIGGKTFKRRCSRCHGNSTYAGITAAMPGYTSLRSGPGGKGNSHKKHVIVNGFMCNVCHSETVNPDNKSIANTTKHVNKQYDIKILRSYSGVYDSGAHTCSMVSCHARNTTPVWGNAAVCQNCHLSNTGDTDKRILNKQAFQNFSEAAPKIYSTSWADSGHGRQQAASGNYYGKDADGNNNGNLAANRICTNCHKSSVPHNTASNPFRLYTTHGGNPNALCEDCHGLNPGNPDAPQPPTSKARGIQTHSSSVVGSVKYNFAIKCIDCHDPHGDNNILMLHSSVARPRITSGTRRESSDLYGRLLTNITTRNIDFVNNQYTTNYARKYQAAKICQNCHTQTKDPSPPYGGRFRWYSAGDKTHGGSKCVNCHSHAKGFKGEGCNGCHGWPPTGLQNIISGAGRINPTKKRASGSVTAGAHFKHFTTFINVGTPGLSRTTVCGLCHKGGMYPNGSESRNIELGFNAFDVYTTGKYRGQSAVATGYYGYSGAAALSGTGSGNNDTTYRCQNVKCHGAAGNWLTKNFGNVTTPRWDDASRNSVFCGSCHGAKKGSGSGTWPTSNRHQKHAGYPSGTGYDFMCRLCHADTVMDTATTLNKTNHVNGKATFKFYTGTFTQNRVWSGSSYNGDDVVNSGFGRCQNLYCHSRGTKTLQPYTGIAFPNYTAKWDASNLPASATEKCSYCHGSKKSAGGYAGITSAMPNQANQAHKKHVVDNGFKCYFCHSATVDSNNAIISITNHVNKFKNISIISTYRTGQTMYSSSLSSTNKTCKNVRCHAGRKTPNWTVAYGTINCPDCHYSNTSDTDNFAWTNFSGNNSVAARIYSTEWTKRGHGKSKASGKYPFSNNTGAQKNCTNCHKPAVKHGDANYFRLYTSNPDSLCMSCHGKGSQLNAWSQGYSDITGIQSHTWNNISTAGYDGGTAKAAANGGWNFGSHDGSDQKKVKCVDCHDPHGDKNNYMIHTYPNFSGSDRVGRPAYNITGVQPMMNFSAVGGPQMNWSSYVKPLGTLGICQRCHSDMGASNAMVNFNKNLYSNHNRGKRCTDCHKHREGFKPSGCDGCHGYPPTPSPTSPNDWVEDAATPSTVGLHTPHAYNPKGRPGITAESDVAGFPGFYCSRCHYNSNKGDSPTMGQASMLNADMKTLTSVYGDWSPGAFKGVTSVTDDTCSNIKCHTPRYYTRTWKKPTGCDDCHGYRNKTNLAFKVQTTNAHKIHVSYTTAGYDKKKYGLACSNCHYNWQGLNNYSTHYSSYVNITANGPVNTKGGQFYGRGRLFEGFSTGGELTNASTTCSKVYCHGNFINGTTTNAPMWKKGAMSTTCGSCHKAKTAKVTGWTNGTTMPEAHPKHVRTAQYNFPCARCHSRTVTNNTTILFAYSSHVNGTKNVIFNTDLNNNGGNFNFAAARKCKNIYCHSSGYRSSPAGSFTTRTTLGRYTASWNDYGANRNTKTGNRPCSYCHGNNIYAGITAAMPNQTSLWGNSHRTHVIRNNFRCVNCHAATVNSAGTINYAGGKHVNGFKNISIISTYKSGQTLYSTSATATMKMTCKNVKCHAGKTTPKWGTYIKCQDCHLSNTGDTDKRISANNAFQYYTAKTGATAPRIYSTAWRNIGHGRQSAYSSGNPAANKTCTNCHKASVAHGMASNPFRLYTINSVNGNPNTLCNDCHGADPGTPASKTNILTHASSVTQTGRHNFAIKCVDCHDPHGDNNRRFMVHSTVVRPRITGTRAEISNANGSIFLSATGRNVDFNQNLYTSDYAKKVTAAKICQVCHTRTFKPGSTAVTRFLWNGSNDKAHGVGPCTNCHSHSQGFKGAACNSCHGFPPTSANNLIGRPGTNQTRTMSGSTTAGAHQKHVTVFGSSNDTCNKCHSGGMAFDSNENDDITLKFNAFNRYTGVNQKYQGQSAVRNGFYGYSGVGAGTGSNLTCSNMKCHGAKGNWLTKSFGTPSSPVWNSPGSVFCGACHGAKKGAGTGSYPTTNAHKKHAGWATGEYDFQCRLCHSATVTTANYTTLDDNTHVNSESKVDFSSSGDSRVDGDSGYSGDLAVNSTFGKCSKTYCHSSGADKVAPFDTAGSYANFTANWPDNRGSYKAPVGSIAKCKYCHGNKNIANYTGVLAAMPNYADGSPKANKHPKHVGDYNFLCTACHVKVTRNNTSIDAPGGTGLNGLHVNRAYNVNFTSVVRSGGSINNSQGRYTSSNSGCRGTYCHSRGTKFSSAPYTNTTALANYTAHWSDDRGSYYSASAGMAKCNYCHGSKNTQRGMTSAMPNYASGSPKANRHPMHVVNYGFACTICHENVTNNNTSIDASGGMGRHVNQSYNVDFKNNVKAGFTNNTGTYTYLASLGGGAGSKCKNTYCHSRGTDRVAPYNTRTSFSNWTARWGDTRGGYKTGAGNKAKCNYCHGNRLFSGVTSAMPNYTSAATNTAKWNTHPIHVRTYGFTCTICHVKVTSNNSSIDAAGGRALHVNQAYNVNFKANVRGNLTNNTGVYSYTDLTTKNKCKNTYCHSRGTDLVKPYNTRTSFANWTARWGDTRGSYKQANGGLKAKCNYCHGNRAYSGMTSAMPNYSGTTGAGYGVTAKANSHRVHVIGNGFVCSTCHNSIAMNNTSISDRTRHVNGFYNISITPTRRKAGGQKVYSMVYNGSGGTCMNNTCHGDSKPQWGNPNSANCKACHFSGTKDTDDYARANSNKAEIYSSEWRRKGHGQFDAFTSRNINRCERCHNKDVPHNFAQGASPWNPFRLFTSESITVCNNCHGTSGERNKSTWPFVTIADGAKTDIVTHSQAATGGDAGWNTHTTVKGKAVKCIDCHDPHGDKNRRMIHSYINHSGSDRFGRPAGPTWGTINYTSNAMMTFTAWGGQLQWSSFANGNPSRSICRRCHTPKGSDPNMGNKPSSPAPGEMTKDNYASSHQSHTATCTASCHSHKSGFKGGGESTGNTDCRTCHGTGDLFTKMRDTNNYHHVMMTASATGSTKYPNKSSFGPGDQNNSARRCLMCHVDHNIFRPDINTDGTGGRSKNLRWSVLAQGNNTGINTDFWPAKRKNATGRTGVDSSSGNYSSTYPIYGPSQYNGVCISCHKNVQYKNTTLVNDAIKTSRARPFPVSLYTSSSHNFQVISGMFVFGSSGRSSFRGNCTKCHRTPNPNGDYGSLSKPAAQQGYGRFPVALHDKNVPSLLMQIATSSSKPLIEQLCYNCHDTLARSSQGPGSMDFYSSIRMNSGAKMIKAAITGKKYTKPIEDPGMAGNHKIDEYYKAVTSVTENSNPTILWNYSTGAPGGVGRHIECVDCHNTHGGNASIRRIVGAPFRGKLDTQQASYFNYTVSTGNKIAGAQKGVWGVSISYSNGVSYRGQTPKFKKIAQVTYQYEVCLKCHSRYAYGTNPPGVPDGLPDPTGTTVVAYDNLGSDVPQADISRMINPNNYGYHPIFKKGRNQPADNANGNWPTAKSNWMYKDRFNNKTAFISVSGLSWNFVPPFSQHSLLACTDCHVADNSNKAAQKFKPDGSPALEATSWTGATLANIEKIDGLLAVAGQTAAKLQTDVIIDGSTPGPGPSELWVVAYGKTTATTTNTKKQTLAAYYGGIPGTSFTMSPTTVPFGAAIGRGESKATNFAGSWPDFEGNTYSAKITTGSGGTVSLDYIGLEGVYTMTAEVRGPHGSMQRWILTDVDREIWFDANFDNSLTAAEKINVNLPVVTGGSYDNVFCWNCHRRDVYAPDATLAYARVSHDSGSFGNSNPWENLNYPNQWGIVCLNCHAGGATGEIHGSFANSSTVFSGPTKINLQRPRGVRLLNGAHFNYNPVTNTCYNARAATPFGGTCTSHTSGGVNPTTNYSYTSW